MALTWTKEQPGIYVAPLLDGTKYQAEKHRDGWHLYHYTGSTAAPGKGGNTFLGAWYTLADAKEKAGWDAERRDSAAGYAERAHQQLVEAMRLLNVAKAAAIRDNEPVIVEAVNAATTDIVSVRRFVVRIINAVQ